MVEVGTQELARFLGRAVSRGLVISHTSRDNEPCSAPDLAVGATAPTTSPTYQPTAATIDICPSITASTNALVHRKHHFLNSQSSDRKSQLWHRLTALSST